MPRSAYSLNFSAASFDVSLILTKQVDDFYHDLQLLLKQLQALENVADFIAYKTQFTYLINYIKYI